MSCLITLRNIPGGEFDGVSPLALERDTILDYSRTEENARRTDDRKVSLGGSGHPSVALH